MNADIAHPATFAAGIPHDTFARLRQEPGPVWTPEPALERHGPRGPIQRRGSGFWAVTQYEQVAEVSRTPEVFSSGRRGAFLADPVSRGDLDRVRQLLINMDDPQHARVRKLATAVFTPRAMRSLRAGVEEHAQAVVAATLAAGEFDAVTDLAAEVPLLVLADLLGMPREDRGLLYRWSNNLVGFDDPEFGGGDVTAFRNTFVEAFEYANALARERRANPREDLITRLATAQIDGRRLEDQEFCYFWLLLVVAGNETTRHLISGSLQALLERPHLVHALRASGGEVPPAAAEELVRWVTPIMQFRRTAMRDATLGGVEIAEGDKVVIYYTSANRDDRVFSDPSSLQLDRRPNPHLAFGIGPHFCLGAHLARTELVAVLTAMLPHLDRLEVAAPVVRLESNFVNGAKSMEVRWGTRSAVA